MLFKNRKLLQVEIINYTFLKCKVKCKAPFYSQVLRQIRGVVQPSPSSECLSSQREKYSNYHGNRNIGHRTVVTQGAKTCRLSGIISGDTRKNRREGFSSLKFFISAGVRKFVII